jgi:hypothetical protein
VNFVDLTESMPSPRIARCQKSLEELDEKPDDPVEVGNKEETATPTDLGYTMKTRCALVFLDDPA